MAPKVSPFEMLCWSLFCHSDSLWPTLLTSFSSQVKYEGEILTKTIANAPEKTEEEKEEEAKQREDVKAAAIAAIQKNQEELGKLATDKKMAEERAKKVAEVLKAKQELLGKLIEEQKKLIVKMEEKKASMSAQERASIMTLLKGLSSSIEAAREDVKKAMLAMSNSSPGMARQRSKTEVEKELLDAEMELYQAQQDAAETPDQSEAVNVGEMQKRVSALRLEASRLGVVSPARGARGGRGFYRGRGPVRGFYTPRGRGRGRGMRRGGRFAGYQGTSVDRRPTRILVHGFDLDKRQELVEHFLAFGDMYEPADQHAEDGQQDLLLHFKTRREAEAAMNGGKSFGGKMLELSWFDKQKRLLTLVYKCLCVGTCLMRTQARRPARTRPRPVRPTMLS